MIECAKMLIKYSVCLLVLFSKILKVNSAAGRTYILFKNTNIWHRFNEQFMVFSDVSCTQCAGHCNQHTSCLSFNHNKHLAICELNAYYPLENSTNYVSDTGWKVYYPQNQTPKQGPIAWQSSTVAWGSADLALDGNIAGNFFSRSCTHTEESTEMNGSWWAMEMESRSVTQIVVYLRSDCDDCSLRNQNIRFLVSKTREDVENNIGTLCATFVGPPLDPKLPQTVTCNNAAVGKYIKVIQGNNLPLSLCEIIVNAD